MTISPHKVFSFQLGSLGKSQDFKYIWSNDQVNIDYLTKICSFENWNELNDVKGFFAAIFKKSKKIFLFCDHLGLYPLYYSLYDNKLFVSASLSKLLDIIPFEPEPMLEGVLSMLLFGHHLADETVFKKIQRCEGGHVLEFSSDSPEITLKKWRQPLTYSNDHNEECIDVHLHEAFVHNVENAIEDQEKIIIPLSGGFDSRAVLGATLECKEMKQICAVTFGGEDTLDFQLGRMIARKVGINHIAFPIGDQIFEESFQKQRASVYGYGYSAFATQPKDMIDYLAYEESRGHPSIWGVGGDAISGSHLHPSDLELKPSNNFEELARLLINKRAYLPQKNVTLFLGLNANEAVEITAKLLQRSSMDRYEKPWQFLDAWDIFVRGTKELISVLPFSRQLWRCPYLNREYFDLMASQSFDKKIHQKSYKRMLASRYKSLFALPTKRLGGKPLVSSRTRDLFWKSRWKVGKVSRIFRGFARRVDGMGRNYGLDQKFLNSFKGQKRLISSIKILMQVGLVSQEIDSMIALAQRDIQLARMLITLSYAFDK